MKIKILYEDSDILAIDKPSGILVHPAPEHPSSKAELTTGQGVRYGASPEKKTIVDIFKKKYPKVEIVHRLDRETSGVMLLAKNAKAHEFFKKQFMGRSVKKIYHAIVNGFIKNDHDIINKPIGRSPSDFRKKLAGRGVRGKLREAITEYKVLKRFETLCVGKRSDLKNLKRSDLKETFQKFSYLEIHPKTGRTHQIRAHMKYINHPIVCDSLYNPNGLCPKGLKRLALHAQSIEFNLPAQARNPKRKTIKIESPLPPEFKKACLALNF